VERQIVKTDVDLKRDVEDELAWDPVINPASVGVAVRDGVVTVSGQLETYAEKHAVENALRRVSGVKAIAMELDVKLAPEHQRSDTDIANAAQMALRWNTLVPIDQIRLTVDKGWITLQGEVDWDYQRRSAEKAVRPLFGVKGISNEITLKPKTAPGDVVRRIEAALRRQAEREVKHMQVEVDGSTVTLRGEVRSWHERQAAQGAAWSAPGVRTVINELRVA